MPLPIPADYFGAIFVGAPFAVVYCCLWCGVTLGLAQALALMKRWQQVRKEC